MATALPPIPTAEEKNGKAEEGGEIEVKTRNKNVIYGAFVGSIVLIFIVALAIVIFVIAFKDGEDCDNWRVALVGGQDKGLRVLEINCDGHEISQVAAYDVQDAAENTLTWRSQAAFSRPNRTIWIVGGTMTDQTNTPHMASFALSPEKDGEARQLLNNMAHNSREAAFTEVEDHPIICGGLQSNKRCDIFIDDKWKQHSVLPTTLIQGGLVNVEGSLYALGAGYLDPSFGNATLVWRTIRKAWEPKASMSMDRVGFGAVATAGTILVCGGRSVVPPIEPLSSCEHYDPDDDAWSYFPPLPQPRVNFAFLVLPDGALLAIGGRQNGDEGETVGKTLDVYDPKEKDWETSDFRLDTDFAFGTANLLED